MRLGNGSAMMSNRLLLAAILAAKRWFCMALLLACMLSATAHANTIRIAAASDLRFAMPHLVAAFEAEYTEYSVNVVYGSSGRFYSQIRNGAPFHLYLSADIYYPQQLLMHEQQQSAHHASNREVFAYAEGQLAAWARNGTFAYATLDAWLQDTLQQPRGRVAIANPQHAPYGEKALEWLQKHPLWPEIEGRLVFAENVAQVAHFVRSGSAQMGILALPLALSNELSQHGEFLPIAVAEHEPIIQGMLITAYGNEHAGAREFFAFMQSVAATEHLRRSGFLIPNQRDINEPE